MKDIDGVLSDAGSGLNITRNVAGEAAFLELLDDHFETLIRSVDSTLLPDKEEAALEVLGFPTIAASAQTDLLAFEWSQSTARGQGVAREHQRIRHLLL